MEKILKCSKCKSSFAKSDLIYIDEKKKFCKQCFEQYEKERAESEAYKILIQYICDGYGVDCPHKKVFKDIGRLKSKGYSYYDIQFAIYYIFNVLKKQMTMLEFGFIEHIIDDSIKFRVQFRNAESTANNTLTKEIIIETSPNLKPNSNNTRLIDIGEL